MKWLKKYNINLEEVHEKNIAGASLTELSKEYVVPKTTLNRYLRNAGYRIQMNRKNDKKPYFINPAVKDLDYDFGSKNTIPWKQTLIYYHRHKCFMCDYDKIVEAHHIIYAGEGGPTSVRNGILLCPNHHAETHAKLLDLTEALVKLGELLERLFKGNQHPSHICKQDTLPRDVEGSTTNFRAKAVIETRAPRSCKQANRFGKEEYVDKFPLLQDMI